MRTPLFAVMALPLLALLAPPTVAGPPEGLSGRMALNDPVADGLRKYRRETDEEKRLQLLEELGPHHDVRVTVAMGAWLEQERDGSRTFVIVGCMLYRHALRGTRMVSPGVLESGAAAQWWQAHKADLRRRTKRLPR